MEAQEFSDQIQRENSDDQGVKASSIAREENAKLRRTENNLKDNIKKAKVTEGKRTTTVDSEKTGATSRYQ
jgi:hypothetical protein